MIRAEELRIGNYVNAEVMLPSLVVHRIQATDICDIEDGDITVEPISLTDEWLLKFDFERKEESGSEYWTIQIGNNLNLTVSLNDNTAGIDVEWRSQGSQIWMMIDTVHKLQNVFYSLTGEELEVKS